MKCCDFDELISAYLDADISDALLARLEAHFRDCEHCLAMYRTMKKTLVLSREYYRMQYRPVPRAVSEQVLVTLRIHYRKTSRR
jgi:predicted anti-sigma-YlaC factor YlaD